MAWYAVYKTSDGELVSVGQTVGDDLESRGLASKEIPGPRGEREVWDRTLLEFVYVPPTPEEIEREQERPNAEERLRTIYTALGNWSDDAIAAEAAWDGWTAAQRMAAMKVVIDRFGKLCLGLRAIILLEARN